MEIKSTLRYTRLYPFGCREWAVSNSATLRQGPFNEVVSRVGDESLATCGRLPPAPEADVFPFVPSGQYSLSSSSSSLFFHINASYTAQLTIINNLNEKNKNAGIMG